MRSSAVALVLAVSIAGCGGGDDADGSTSGSNAGSAGVAGAAGAAGAAAGASGAGSAGAAGPAGAGGTGGAGSGGAGQGGAAGAPFTPAPHPAPPQVVSLGGKVLTNPKAVAIVYDSDPRAKDIDGFLKELSTTSYWAETTAEYGVGPLSVGTTLHIATAPPKSMTDAALAKLLQTNLADASAPWGAVDPDAIYVYFAPQGTSVVADGGCCDAYDGYHDEVKIGSVSVPYAVVCACAGDPNGIVAQITVAASHELVEAATDPLPRTKTAWAETDDDHAVWTVATGGEVADMCEFNLDTSVVPAGSTFRVQRSWSNAAALSGKNPCVPAPNAPYFNAVPVLPDAVSISYGGPWPTQGVKVAVGETKAIPVQLFSEADVGAWKVSAFDLEEFLGGAPTLKLSLDKGSGTNGDALSLSITVTKAQPGGHAFVLLSEKDGQSNLSMGAVVD